MSTTYKDYLNDPKTIYLKTNVDLTDAKVVKGLYFKPGDKTGTYITGTISDHNGDDTNRWIKLTVAYNTLTPSGVWRWQSYFEFPEHTSGHGVHGSVEKLIIYELGE